MKRGRPRRWKGYRITSFYIPDEMVPVYEKLREIAFAEGVPINDKILDAICEYVERNSPEVLSREPKDASPLKELKEIEASTIATELKATIATLSSDRTPLDVRVTTAREVAPKLVKRLAKLNAFLNNEEYTKLCRTAVRLIEEAVQEWLKLR